MASPGRLDADVWTAAQLRDATIVAELAALNLPRPGKFEDSPDDAALRPLYRPRMED